MKFSMLGNGLDFLVTGISHLQTAEKENIEEEKRARELKYSLLHLSAGIDLVFKSRLNIEHWTYIFDDMNNASKEKYFDGSLKSVDSNTAVKRLEQLCEYTFENKQKQSLKRLRDTRNRFEHGFIDSNPKAIEAIINAAIVVIVDFIEKNFDEFDLPTNYTNFNSGMSETEIEYYRVLIKETSKLKNHHDDAVRLALKRALSVTLQEELMECPECGEKLLRHADEDSACECYFCGYIEDSTAVAKHYIDKVMQISEYETFHHGGEYPLFICPDCGCESLVKENNVYVCFNCGIRLEQSEVRECNSCGKLFYPGEDDEIICKDCWNQILKENE